VYVNETVPVAFTGQNKTFFAEVRKMKKLIVLLMIVAVAGLSSADLVANALDPSHIVASPGKSVAGDDSSPVVLDRQGNFQGEWAFTLWALYAVNGDGLTGLQHQTGDTGAMYMDDSGFSDMPTGLDAFDNNTYRGYINAMFDGSYNIDKLHVWNFNGVAGRGFNDVDLWVSNDNGASYTYLQSLNFVAAPVSSSYTGETYDIIDGYYTDIVIAAQTNHGDGSWIGLSEVQFVQVVPEPLTLTLLGLGGFFIRRKR
jgi:hypothetical protein